MGLTRHPEQHMPDKNRRRGRAWSRQLVQCHEHGRAAATLADEMHRDIGNAPPPRPPAQPCPVQDLGLTADVAHDLQSGPSAQLGIVDRPRCFLIQHVGPGCMSSYFVLTQGGGQEPPPSVAPDRNGAVTSGGTSVGLSAPTRAHRCCFVPISLGTLHRQDCNSVRKTIRNQRLSAVRGIAQSGSAEVLGLSTHHVIIRLISLTICQCLTPLCGASCGDRCRARTAGRHR